LTYEEWIKYRNVKVITEDYTGCDGDGVVECFSCGEERDCEECEGTGEIDLTYEEHKKTQFKNAMFIEKNEREKRRVQP
jgi:hypothetical protein